MNAKIHVVVDYSSQYETPALYWSERKALGVPDELHRYDAMYPLVLEADVDPDEWIRRLGKTRRGWTDDQHQNYTYLHVHSANAASWQWIKGLDFATAFTMVERQRRQWRREDALAQLCELAPLKRLIALAQLPFE